MIIFYFTGTGNTLAIAKRIGGDLVSIPQVIDTPTTLYKDDVIGVVFPVYGQAPPIMVRNFLDKVTFEAEYIFAIGTCGYLPGACMLNTQKRAKMNGYRFDYAVSIRMVDNFLYNFEMGKEIESLPDKNIEGMTAKILTDVGERKHTMATSSLAWRAFFVIMDAVSKTEKRATRYIVNERCNKCGTCTKVCPAKNVEVTDSVHFNEHCEGCLACVHLCPKNAIHLKNEKSSKRWINPSVSLNEIIAANNRMSI